MADKQYKAIFVPVALHRAIKQEAAQMGHTMIEELQEKYNHYEDIPK